MKLRHLKRRHDARQVRWLEWYRGYQAELSAAPDYWPDDDCDDDFSCTRCGGSAYSDDGDPFWDDVDEFGQIPCPYCHGTGERAHQTIF